MTISLLGWGATDRTGEQSRYPRQLDLTLNATSDCNCSSVYFLETNVGPDGEDTCEGDSGQTERSSRNVPMILSPGGPLITEDAAGVFTLVGILKAETSTEDISDKIIILTYH